MGITRKEIGKSPIKIWRPKDGYVACVFRGRPERNNPCPCGSGKKYKKCCLNKKEEKDPVEIKIPVDRRLVRGQER